jgi:hypothetical protein
MSVRLGERYGSVARLWQSCWPLEADRDVAGWLNQRRIAIQSVVSRDLARALARGIGHGLGHRLVVPIYDPWGELSALAAVDVCHQSETVLLGARQIEGMVFANPIGRYVLAGVGRDAWTWRTIILTAGPDDYLQWAAALAASDEGPAVIGIADGHWSKLLAARVPDGCRVIVRGDTNPAVAQLAPHVVEALGARCEVIVRAGV